MSTKIHRLAVVDPQAELGNNVEIGPFCVIGPQVRIGDDCVLDSNVTIVGITEIGVRNRFFPGCVIGTEPQDLGYKGAPTRLFIGTDNIIREGVTIHRGAEKEDGSTRIGNGNFFMANSHVAHNCVIHDQVIIVNGVLLGGHVHVHSKAVISGNTVVHHFCTVGTMAMIGGGARVVVDVPPYMLAVGGDKFTIHTINFVGLTRAGIPSETITAIKRAHRLLYRENKRSSVSREIMEKEQEGRPLPMEVAHLLDFVAETEQGRVGRGGERRRRAA